MFKNTGKLHCPLQVLIGPLLCKIVIALPPFFIYNYQYIIYKYCFLFLTGLYALINNAGICVCGEFEWQTWSQIQKQVEVNILGTLRVTKQCIPLLKAGQGKI
jgi:NAD(P)-dependent dehydrogenase (short-subunit alcohol dehydrogenase family)